MLLNEAPLYPSSAITAIAAETICSRRAVSMNVGRNLGRTLRILYAHLIIARRLAAVLGLLLLAPISAEYLIAYDTSTGNPSALIAGLIFLAPLYGGAGLLIRETARRLRLRWPGIICLAGAFGVIQAGLVDQSLFNRTYRDIPYWEAMTVPTWIPVVGISGYTTLSFVTGHIIWSICAPIAIVDSLEPRLRDWPWLSRPALAVVAGGYLLFSGLILVDHIASEEFLATPAQLVGAALVSGALVVIGLYLGRRFPAPTARPAPSPWLVAGVAAAIAAGLNQLPVTWAGVGLGAAAFTALTAAVAWFGRSPRWTQQHQLALAGAALFIEAASGFLVDPLGDGDLQPKLIHNAMACLLVAGLCGLAAYRVTGELGPSRRSDRETCAPIA